MKKIKLISGNALKKKAKVMNLENTICKAVSCMDIDEAHELSDAEIIASMLNEEELFTIVDLFEHVFPIDEETGKYAYKEANHFVPIFKEAYNIVADEMDKEKNNGI